MLKYIKEMINIFNQTSFEGLIRYIAYKQAINLNFSLINRKSNSVKLILLGSGTYAASILLPSMSIAKILPNHIISKSNVSANNLSNAWGLKNSDFSIESIKHRDFNTDAMVIATPHETHPEYIAIALDKNIYAYCEKPVAIDKTGIIKLNNLLSKHPDNNRIMIGFNRRFSPAISKIMDLDFITNRKKPLELTYRINFGKRIQNSMSNIYSGGGRLIGAGCHYTDLINYIVNSEIKDIYAVSGSDENTFSAVINFFDSSIATIIFTSEGDRDFDYKEEISISSSGHMIKINDFKKLKINGKTTKISKNTYGAVNAMQKFSMSVKNSNKVPISLADGILATSITLAIQESIDTKSKINFSNYMETMN